MISHGRAGKNQADSHGNSREREFPSLSASQKCKEKIDISVFTYYLTCNSRLPRPLVECQECRAPTPSSIDKVQQSQTYMGKYFAYEYKHMNSKFVPLSTQQI